MEVRQPPCSPPMSCLATQCCDSNGGRIVRGASLWTFASCPAWPSKRVYELLSLFILQRGQVRGLRNSRKFVRLNCGSSPQPSSDSRLSRFVRDSAERVDHYQVDRRSDEFSLVVVDRYVVSHKAVGLQHHLYCLLARRSRCTAGKSLP